MDLFESRFVYQHSPDPNPDEAIEAGQSDLHGAAGVAEDLTADAAYEMIPENFGEFPMPTELPLDELLERMEFIEVPIGGEGGRRSGTMSMVEALDLSPLEQVGMDRPSPFGPDIGPEHVRTSSEFPWVTGLEHDEGAFPPRHPLRDRFEGAEKFVELLSELVWNNEPGNPSERMLEALRVHYDLDDLSEHPGLTQDEIDRYMYIYNTYITQLERYYRRRLQLEREITHVDDELWARMQDHFVYARDNFRGMNDTQRRLLTFSALAGIMGLAAAKRESAGGKIRRGLINLLSVGFGLAGVSEVSRLFTGDSLVEHMQNINDRGNRSLAMYYGLDYDDMNEREIADNLFESLVDDDAVGGATAHELVSAVQENGPMPRTALRNRDSVFYGELGEARLRNVVRAVVNKFGPDSNTYQESAIIREIWDAGVSPESGASWREFVLNLTIHDEQLEQMADMWSQESLELAEEVWNDPDEIREFFGQMFHLMVEQVEIFGDERIRRFPEWVQEAYRNIGGFFGDNWTDFFNPDEFPDDTNSEIVERMPFSAEERIPSIFTLRTREGGGTAFLVSRGPNYSYLVTSIFNIGSVEDLEGGESDFGRIRVFSEAGLRMTGEYVNHDAENNIAMIRIPTRRMDRSANDVQPLDLNSSDLELDSSAGVDDVRGNAWVLGTRHSRGSIARDGAYRRREDTPGNEFVISNRVDPGWGGAPIFNDDGEVMGIVIRGRNEVSDDGDVEPGAFGVTSNAIEDLLNSSLVQERDRQERLQHHADELSERIQQIVESNTDNSEAVELNQELEDLQNEIEQGTEEERDQSEEERLQEFERRLEELERNTQ